MIILSKKRILLSIMVVTFSILTIAISNASLEEKNSITETVALPVSNKVIVLDARTWNSR